MRGSPDAEPGAGVHRGPVPASLPLDSRSLRVATRLGELHVREIGDGPAAVLWHGIFADGSVWNGMLSALSIGRRLIVVDGPGHGRSEPLAHRTPLDACVPAAVDLLDGLGVRGPVDWLGNGWGGHVGIAFAAAEPARTRSLTAVSSPTEPIDETQRRRIRRFELLLQLVGATGSVREAILESQLSDPSRLAPATRAVLDDALARMDRAGISRAVKSFVLDRPDLTRRLPAVAAPALFVATDDRPEWGAADAAAAAAVARDGRSALVAGARTLVPLERPDALAEQVLRFWSRAAERASAA
jgi:pimeloyl-ACP methyl ester carboxylesterase